MTHNQALNILDVLVNTVALAITDTPPDKVNEGDIYIVGSNPQGIFDGNANNLAQISEGSWTFYQPLNYMEVMVVDKREKLTFIDNVWVPLISPSTASSDSGKANSDKANDESYGFQHWQEDLNLSGKIVSSKMLIPHHSLGFCRIYKCWLIFYRESKEFWH